MGKSVTSVPLIYVEVIGIKIAEKNNDHEPDSSEIDSMILESLIDYLSDPTNDFVKARKLSNRIPVGSRKIGFFLKDLQQQGYLKIWRNTQKGTLYQASDIDRLKELEISDL